MRKSPYKITDEGRECSLCRVFKPWSEFYVISAASKQLYGRASSCKKCSNTRTVQWRRDNNYQYSPEKRRLHYLKNRDLILRLKQEQYDALQKKNYDLIHKYGISIGTYDKMLLEQNGQCKTCGREIGCTIREDNVDAAVVDHYHKTGKVRGLLCHSCNRAIGLLGENIETLNNITLYLEFYNG